MKTTVVLSALLAASSSLFAADHKPAPPLHPIVLSVGEGPFTFTRAVPLKVSYRNGGKEPWELPTVPSESMSAQLSYRPSGSTRRPQGDYFGRAWTVTNSFGHEMQCFPLSKPMSIAPGRSYDFEVPFQRAWTGDLTPGVWTVWVEDWTQGLTNKLVSNTVDVHLRFTAESVTNCLEVAINKEKKRIVDDRRDHGRWLHATMPTLKLQWWDWDTPAPERETMEAEVQRQLKTFQEYWENPANAPAIAAAIDKINREANIRSHRFFERGVSWDSDANWPTNAPPPLTNSVPSIGRP